MKKNLIIKGSLKGSKPSLQDGSSNAETSIAELIAKIKFRRTIRRIIKLIRS